MKKLTAGIFTVLIGLCAANSADAAIASKAWVEQDFATKTSLADEKSALQGEIALKANAADVYTKGEVYTKTESDGRFDAINAAQNALESAQDYTDAQLKTLTDQFGTAGDGEGEGTGLAGTVAGHTIQIGALESKVGDTAVATQISNALMSYTNTEGMNAAIKVVADELAEHEKNAAETYQTTANMAIASVTVPDENIDKVYPTEARMMNKINQAVTDQKSITDSLGMSIENLEGSVEAALEGVQGSLDALSANKADKTALEVLGTTVSANTEVIAAINNAETGVLKQSKDYTDTEIDKLEQSLSGTSTNLTELSETVTTNTENIAKNAAAIVAEDARAKAAEEANATAAATAQAQADKGVADAKAAADAAAANLKTLADQAALISANSDNIAANTAKFGNYTETEDLSILATNHIPTACSNDKNKCVLTYGTTAAGTLGFEWEVVERETVTE